MTSSWRISVSLSKTVAAFPLHRGDPEGEHAVQAGPACGDQFSPAGPSGGFNGAENAPAPGHDLHVAVTAKAPGEFIGPVTAEDEVGVGIHKSGKHRFAGRIDDGKPFRVDACRHLGGSSHGGDAAVFDPYRPVLDDPQVVHGRSPLPGGKAAAGDQLGGVFDDEVAVHSPSPVSWKIPSTRPVTRSSSGTKGRVM